MNNPLTGKVCIGHPAAKRLGVEGGSGRAHLQISRKALPRSASPPEIYAIETRDAVDCSATQGGREAPDAVLYERGSLFEERALRLITEQLRSDIEERVGALEVSVLAQTEIVNSQPSMLTPPSPRPESRLEPSNDMGKLVTATSPQPYWMKSWLPSIAVSPEETIVSRRFFSLRSSKVSRGRQWLSRRQLDAGERVMDEKTRTEATEYFGLKVVQVDLREYAVTNTPA